MKAEAIYEKAEIENLCTWVKSLQTFILNTLVNAYLKQKKRGN